jgi:hypothetical protein
MQRITVQEAEHFVPLDLDEHADITKARYFTLSPSKRGPEWEDVTYYLHRRVNQYEGRLQDGDGWVYILATPSQPGMYKIGYTDQEDVQERVKQINRSTGLALNCDLQWAFRCFNAKRLEGEVHKRLSSARVNNRKEWFAISLTEAKEAIKELGEKYI